MIELRGKMYTIAEKGWKYPDKPNQTLSPAECKQCVDYIWRCVDEGLGDRPHSNVLSMHTLTMAYSARVSEKYNGNYASWQDVVRSILAGQPDPEPCW